MKFQDNFCEILSETVFKLIVGIEKYSETIAKIEQMSKFMHIVLVEMTSIGILIPAVIITLINFYVYDLGDRSYFLAYPMMYV